MQKRYDIMVAGHLCIDIIPRFQDAGKTKIEDIMRPGKLINVDAATISTGGPVSNTGISMKKLGFNVCFCACVGDDRLGRLTIDMLRESGNAEGVRVLKKIPSSYTVVIAPPGIDRIFLHNPGTNNKFSANDLNPDLIRQCRHFHFGYPPLMEKMFVEDGAELETVFKIAKQTGATTSCDMTLPDPASPSGKAPWQKILARVLPHVDIFVPSVEEALYMLHPDEFIKMKQQYGGEELIDHLTPEDYSRIADELLSMGCKMTTLKSGHRGFYIKTKAKETFETFRTAESFNKDNWAGCELWAPAFKPSYFGSATGSGDASIAGLLSAFLRGLKIEDAIKYATCCGLQNVRTLDAVSGIKSWDETTAMQQDNLPMIDAHIEAAGWTWDEDQGLWAGPKDKL